MREIVVTLQTSLFLSLLFVSLVQAEATAVFGLYNEKNNQMN